jgi:hypothetical protein
MPFLDPLPAADRVFFVQRRETEKRTSTTAEMTIRSPTTISWYVDSHNSLVTEVTDVSEIPRATPGK